MGRQFQTGLTIFSYRFGVFQDKMYYLLPIVAGRSMISGWLILLVLYSKITGIHKICGLTFSSFDTRCIQKVNQDRNV